MDTGVSVKHFEWLSLSILTAVRHAVAETIQTADHFQTQIFFQGINHKLEMEATFSTQAGNREHVGAGLDFCLASRSPQTQDETRTEIDSVFPTGKLEKFQYFLCAS